MNIDLELNNLENKKRGLNRKFSNDRSLQLQINKQKVELLFTQTNKYIQKEILNSNFPSISLIKK